MKQKEKKDWERLSVVIRCARKDLSIRQTYASKMVGISQGAYSKMEAGKLIPSVSQWYRLCRLLQLHPEQVYHTGRIDNLRKVEVKDVSNKVGLFSISRRYRNDMGTSVRNLLPFVEIAQKAWGQKKWHDYLESVGLDPDYFLNLDHQLNFNFLADLIQALSRKSGIHSEHVIKAALLARDPLSHGQLDEQYRPIQNKLDLVKKLVFSMDYYEADFVYVIESESRHSVDVSIQLANHLKKSFNWDSDAVNHYYNYMSQRFRYFAEYNSGQAGTPSLESTQLSQHPTAGKRILRLALAG